MKDNQIINYLKNKNFTYHIPLREMSNDNQIVRKVREAANELL